MCMITLSGKATLKISFHLSFHFRETLNGKNLLLWKQILLFKSRPLFRRFLLAQGSEQKVIKLISCNKMAGKDEGVHKLLTKSKSPIQGDDVKGRM